jgi:GT2 family glycosyltransferase
MSMSKPKVSVVVPHYSDLRGLDLCLSALGKQSYGVDNFEVIVADNASPEGESAVSGAVAGRARLIIVQERGAGPARNGAVQVADGDILAFIDSDCQAEQDWLAEGVRALTSYDFIGGRVKVLVDDPRHMTPVEAFESVFAFDFKTYITKKGFTGAGNLFCTRSLFHKVGNFRAGVSEDVDWSHRARSHGYRLGYAPKAVVGHPARRNWIELEAKWRRIDVETYRLTGERRSGSIAWVLRIFALPFSAMVHTPKVLMSKDLNTPRQRFNALIVLYRLRLWRMADALRLSMRR